jgi:4-carboxymuconolactone decarboxylase
MSRLRSLRRHDLDPSGQAVWDQIVAGRGSQMVADDGGLSGPFNAWVHAPEVGSRLADLGGYLRFNTSMPRRLTEVAIITVAARWKAEFEWWAHARMARDHGVPGAAVDAIGRGEEPAFDDDDQDAVYQVARRLAHHGRLDEATYTAAQSLLGDAGMVELVSLCGYYTLISYQLNAFQVALPAGEDRQWPGEHTGDR